MTFFPGVPQAVNNLGANPAIYTVARQLTAEQIRGLVDTPVAIVEAQPGVVVLPLSAVIVFQAATPPSAFSGSVGLQWSLGPTTNGFPSTASFDGTLSGLWWDDDDSTWNAISQQFASGAAWPGFIGAALNMSSQDSVTDGDGSLAVFVTYFSATVIPPLTALDFLISSVDQGAQTFTVDGDATTVLFPGMHITVAGSTGNDGSYTVVAVTPDSGPTTIIEVAETIPDSTADGAVIFPT